MYSEQQKQALEFFDQTATQWNANAHADNPQKYNMIKARNDVVLAVAKTRAAANLLDIGCGSGELVIDAAAAGIDALGIDFAQEMIALGERQAQEQGLQNATFACRSVFDYDFADARFDVIGANGLIEYISQAQLETLFQLCHTLLNEDGALVFGSRNRLFNLHSLNAFTQQELELGNVPALMKEAIAMQSGATIGDLADMETAPLQPQEIKHHRTAIEVETRYQYTPAQLAQWVQRRGYTVEQLVPLHFHGVPMVFKGQYPDIHTSIANTLHNFPDHLSLIPYSSTFMVYAVKA